MKLNKGQDTAKRHKDGPMMVLAGPGSGKTTVITHRVQHLVQELHIDPSQILVITYTKVAATHMQARYQALSQGGYSSVTFSTFHGLFFKILRAHTGISIDNLLNEDERTHIIKFLLKENGIDHDEETLQSVSLEISLVNNDQLDINYFNSLSLVSADFKTIARAYNSYKQEHNKIDFDDMLTKCYDILSTNQNILKIWQNKYKYIMVDEFQDINKVQYNVVKLLASCHNNIYIVGDDDQSIYKFRGARPQFLLDFPKDFENTKTSLLDTNYRSSDAIIKMANVIISQNTLRYNKVITGTKQKGPSPKLIKTKDIDSEAKYIAKKIKELNLPLDDICVVYRTNIQARALVDAFSIYNIPYKIKDEAPSVYEHPVSKDMCAYMALALNIDDAQAFETIANKPKRYISKSILALLKKQAREQNITLMQAFFETNHLKHWQKQPVEDLLYHLGVLKKQSPAKAIKYIRNTIGYNGYIKEYATFKKTSPKGLYEILEELTAASSNFETLEEYLQYVQDFSKIAKDNKDTNGVQLSTMHGVKGLEYTCVFVVSCVESLIPHEKSQTQEEIEEERRLFYVAVTRAKTLLYLSVIQTRHEENVKPTRFLKGIIRDE